MNPVLKSKIIKFVIGAVIGFLFGLFAGIITNNEVGITVAYSILGTLCGISCAVSFKKFVDSFKFLTNACWAIGIVIPVIGYVLIAMAYVFRIVLTIFIGWIFGFINAILEIHCAARYGVDLTTYKSQNNQ